MKTETNSKKLQEKELGSGLPLDDDLIKYVEEQKKRAMKKIAQAKQKANKAKDTKKTK